LIGFVRASFVGLMKAYHATGDSTNFPVPCKMAHEPTDYRTLYRPFLYYYDWREARTSSELLRAQVAYDSGNGLLLRVFERWQQLKPIL
jgi:hypothetical protein